MPCSDASGKSNCEVWFNDGGMERTQQRGSEVMNKEATGVTTVGLQTGRSEDLRQLKNLKEENPPTSPNPGPCNLALFCAFSPRSFFPHIIESLQSIHSQQKKKKKQPPRTHTGVIL